MNDWLIGVICCIGMLATLIIGFAMGSDMWATDCEKHGMHIKGDHIYVCHKSKASGN